MDVLPNEYFILFYSVRFPAHDTGRFLFSLHDIWKTRHNVRTSGRHRTKFNYFLRNLSQFYHLKCKDHRDRVYAILSISSDMEVDEHSAISIRPDYSEKMTPNALSKQLTVFCIKKRGSRSDTVQHRILNLVCGLRQTAEIPSWCINVDLPDSYEKPDLVPANQWSPHPRTSLPAWPTVLDDQLTMIVKGRKLDTISWASPVHSHPSGWYDRLHPILSFYQEIIDRYLHGPGLTVGKAASLCRTLAPHNWDLAPHKVLTEEQHLAFIFLHSFRNYVRSFMKRPGAKQYQKASETDISDTFLDKLSHTIATLSALLPPGYGEDATKDTRQERKMAWGRFEAAETISGRCFCVSKTGRYCNVMHQVQEGDVVVSLEGYDRLFVLRPVEGERYQIIGDAYVDGLMRGEAYEGLDPDEVDCDIALV